MKFWDNTEQTKEFLSVSVSFDSGFQICRSDHSSIFNVAHCKVSILSVENRNLGRKDTTRIKKRSNYKNQKKRQQNTQSHDEFHQSTCTRSDLKFRQEKTNAKNPKNKKCLQIPVLIRATLPEPTPHLELLLVAHYRPPPTPQSAPLQCERSLHISY